ncbi:MAG: acyl carrier protein [Pseudomonadota bacterium]
MSVEDITRRVDAALASVFKIDVHDVPIDMSHDTHAEWDSAAYLTVVLAVEEQFGVQFTPEEIENAMGREKLIAVLDRRLAG